VIPRARPSGDWGPSRQPRRQFPCARIVRGLPGEQVRFCMSTGPSAASDRELGARRSRANALCELPTPFN